VTVVLFPSIDQLWQSPPTWLNSKAFIQCGSNAYEFFL
jgi:hypothetical protein